jgi:hypothetical protein
LDVNDTDEIIPEEFHDPNSNITKGFLFMYSLETFLYKNLNKADR